MSMTEETKPTSGGQESLSRSAARHRETAVAMSDRVKALSLGQAEAPGASHTWRYFWIACVALAVAAALWGKPVYQKLADGGGMAGVEVDAVVVSLEQPVEVVLDASGYIITRSTVKVSPNIPGTVVELNFAEGDRVERGDVLARLDDTQYRADLDQAKASLTLAEAHLAELRKGSRDEDIEQARAALAQAAARRDLLRKNAARAEKLKGTISQSDYDQAKASLLEADANVEQLASTLRLVESGPRQEQIEAAAAEVERARALLNKSQYFVDCTDIVSPMTGTIVRRDVELGERVVPESLTASMFQIADLSRLEAEIDIPEHELANIRLGQPCVITTEAYPGQEYEGKLQWFSPTGNRQRGVRRAKVAVAAPDERLLPEMTCRVRVLHENHAEQAEPKMLVPEDAVVEESGRKLVWVLHEERVLRKPVETGETSKNMVEIVKGLDSGEVLLLPGSQPLTEGQKVRPRLRGKNAAA